KPSLSSLSLFLSTFSANLLSKAYKLAELVIIQIIIHHGCQKVLQPHRVQAHVEADVSPVCVVGVVFSGESLGTRCAALNRSMISSERTSKSTAVISQTRVGVGLSLGRCESVVRAIARTRMALAASASATRPAMRSIRGCVATRVTVGARF